MLTDCAADGKIDFYLFIALTPSLLELLLIVFLSEISLPINALTAAVSLQSLMPSECFYARTWQGRKKQRQCDDNDDDKLL